MKIHETLQRDPRRSPLANNGQARISTLTDDNTRKELEAELTTFVCDGQYGEAIQRILQSYLNQQGQPQQNAAWVSGFFGSGKSHLQKMLGHLWANTELSGGRRARDLVVELPEDVRAQFKELDTLAHRSGQPLIAASGAMPSGVKDAVRATVLAIVLRSRDLPEKVAQARFCFWLQQRGFLKAVRAAVEAEGSKWFDELDNLYVSPVIAQAVLEQDPDFATDKTDARKVIREQFPNPGGDITTTDFVKLARKALAPHGGELPHTMLVLDEVQQYIGESNDRATGFVEVAEALQKEMDSRVLLVASGQSALSSETPQLQKLKDRFRINVQLSDTDVETVVRKVVLQKRADAQVAVQRVLEANAGEISKQLQHTGIKERSEDRQVAAADYPLLPARRRFWEACFRSVDAGGTNSQLRSQLRISFDAVKDIAGGELGQVITADVLFQAMAPDLVSSGVLLNELNNRITRLADNTEAGRLKQSLCGLAFLISRLPREQGADLGVRATARTLADLMVADLRSDSGPLRQRLAQLLEAMAEDGTLMKVGDQPGLEEYRLQTTEGAQWQGRFEEQRQAVRNDAREVISKREKLLATAVREAVKGVKLCQGDARIPRRLNLWISDEPPAPSQREVVVWVRDGWGCSEKEVRDAARQAGADDPVLHVFLPRHQADELKARIIDATAARRVIDHYGTPSTAEGQEARSAMQSRRSHAEENCNELIAAVIANALVLKGGGAEEDGTTLAAKVEAASEASLARLFPKFTQADHGSWGHAVKRAKEGSDTPLEAVGHRATTDTHPVARQILSTIGAAKKGRAIRDELVGVAPYGWPQDAVDAVLLALHRDGTLSASDISNNPITPGRLNHQNLAKATFVPQKVRLTTMQPITPSPPISGLPSLGHLRLVTASMATAGMISTTPVPPKRPRRRGSRERLDPWASAAHPFPVEAATPLSLWDSDQPLKAHSLYRQAKAGDRGAAIDLTWELAVDFLSSLTNQLSPGLTYVAPYAREATGDNAIPLMLASACAVILKGQVETEIVQASRVFHTGARPMERLLLRPRFDGAGVAGTAYVLVDDVTCLGGTLAELADHIQSHGGRVAAVVTLVNAGRLKPLRPEIHVINRLARGSLMPSETPSASIPVPSPPTKPVISMVSERLTNSEIAQLRQQKRSISAYAQRVFSSRLSQRP